MPLSGHSGHFSNKIQKNTPSSRPARTNNLGSTLQPTFLKQSPNLYSLPYALPISRKHTQNARKRSCNTRTYAHKLPANNLPAASQRRSNNCRRIYTRSQMLLPSLVTTRKTLVNTRKRSCITRPCTPKLLANNLPASGQRRSNSRRSNSRRRISTRFHMLLQSLVTTLKTLVTTRKRSCITRPCTHELPANNLQAARQRSSNNRPQIFIRCQMLRQSLVNTRKRSCFTRPCTPKLPANNLRVSRQRHYNTRPQISTRCQMLLPSLVNTRKRSCITRPCTHKLPANNLQAPCQRRSNNRRRIYTRCQMHLQSLVNTRKTLVNARASLVPALTNCLQVACEYEQVIGAREPYLMPPRAGYESSQSAIIRLSPFVVCYPGNPVIWPPPTPAVRTFSNGRKPVQTTAKLSSYARDLSQNTHTSTRLFAAPLPSRKSPRIPQILLQTTKQIRPPSTAPPPTILPLPHFQYRVQAVLLSPIHYPLQFPLVISPQPCYRVPTVSTAARSGSSGGRKWRT